MLLLRRIYTFYAFLVFLITFILLFPVFLMAAWIPGWQKYGRLVNQYWAKIYFVLIGMPVKMEGSEHIKKGQPYVFVANHFSYLDIPFMGFIPGDVVFVGKSSIGKVPLFGYYFKKLHIAVNRASIKSRGEVLIRAKKAITQGSSIVIFPEGGITTGEPPHMNRFKDGAFSLAIDKQIPLIPVTLSYNHIILPDDGRLLLNFKKGKIVIHPPLDTKGLNSKDLPQLKENCYRLIQDQLWKDNQLPETEKTIIKTT
ncbi:lysophospholipid acyltransferase family protein [Cecembia lonarensis]|uniref:2-acyl-glycerophospho-ethanolamine acyltransferase n=1 Tax=Cecembia lonarensis (strain CCUG 58316 / KCTC 22772 / LW9) TaxID=1225176 RepID=K1L4G5_CECL9|nr:1-acyl-sn-glycerol-3-phosphate acyltransferase [Cecembia lonarensis]EKB49671.1 2-acyl-glycerophospho-ethanolamine acyltransferase [Cecembia lonarensis LW9]